MSVYPNPTNGSNTQIEVVSETTVQVSIIDMKGTVTKRLALQGGTHSLDLSQLSSGMYQVIAQDEHETLRQRLIIQ
jgi:hypothetical protein